VQGLRPFDALPSTMLRTGRTNRGLLRAVRLGFGAFEIRICFGFRASDFVLGRPRGLILGCSPACCGIREECGLTR
jgi:hypothetical protein